jgi:peptidoglycan/LPS O-acetylase OafA/YrhL
MTTQRADQREHGLDAVRGLALVAGVVLHAAMAFLPGPQLWVVADSSRSTTLSVAFFVIHMARMTVFFVLAGFFARLMFHRMGATGFMRNRLARVAAPLVLAWPLGFGAILMVMGAAAPAGAPAGPGLALASFPLTHLWFLYVLLLLYAGALSLRGVVAAADRAGRLRRVVDTMMRGVMGPWSAALLAAPVAGALYAHPYWFMWFGVPTPDVGFVPARAAMLPYGLAFGIGWLLQRQATLLLPRLQRHWAVHLALAMAATVFCLATTSLAPLLAPAPFGAAKLQFAIAYAVGLWSWAFALLGLGLRFLNGPSPARRYLADASYWIYLAHLPLVMALQQLVRDWPLPWPIKFPLLLGITMVVLLLSYHWLVRPTAIGALLNGRRHPRGGRTSPPDGIPLVKALSLLLLLPATLSAQAVVAPAPLPLDTVLARHAAAVGPVQRIQARRSSVRVTGMAPFEIPVVIEAMRPDLLLKRVTLQGAVQVTGYDGRDAWRIDPFASASGKPVDVPAAELADLLEEADFDGPLVHTAEKGIRLRYVGPRVVPVAGKPTPVHAVEVSWANGRQSLVHLHAASYLEVLRTQRRQVMGRDIAMTITPSDYRVVQGIKVPFLVEIAPEGMPQPIRVRVDAVDLGAALDRKQFGRP